MKRLIIAQIIILSFITLVGTGIIVFLLRDSTGSNPITSPVFKREAFEIMGLDEEQKDILRREVISIHMELNLAVGFGATPTEQIANSLRSKARYLEITIDQMIDFEPLDEDLQELIVLINNAVVNDRNSWIRAHRIAHDLDYYLFNPRQQPGNPFGVTRTLPAIAKEISRGNN